jgi:hypothetical protein
LESEDSEVSQDAAQQFLKGEEPKLEAKAVVEEDDDDDLVSFQLNFVFWYIYLIAFLDSLQLAAME